MRVIANLVRLLEEKKDDEVAVLLISRTLLVPIVFALSPETHSVNAKKTLETLDELDATAF